MARGRPSNGGQPAHDPTARHATDGYLLLIAAVLKQAMVDAQKKGGYGWRDEYQAEAQAFLEDREAVGTWISLCGADADNVQRLLLTNARHGRRE